jgi:hypothetical protein
MRKTIEVQKVKELVNEMLASSLSEEQKTVARNLIEKVLMDTGNYKGFQFLNKLENNSVRYY